MSEVNADNHIFICNIQKHTTPELENGFDKKRRSFDFIVLTENGSRSDISGDFTKADMLDFTEKLNKLGEIERVVLRFENIRMLFIPNFLSRILRSNLCFCL